MKPPPVEKRSPTLRTTPTRARPRGVDQMLFPDGLHRFRRVVDVAAFDPVLGEGVYIRYRARVPRPWWSPQLVSAVRAVAAELEEAA